MSNSFRKCFIRFARFVPAAGAVVFALGLACQSPKALILSGDYALTHDPSIAKDGNVYYVFATSNSSAEGQLPIRCSTDLLAWRRCGYVFDKIPDWIHQASPKTDLLWAPDISYYRGKFHLYYAYSIFGKNTSGIAEATNETLDPTSPKYHWSDEGLLLKSTLEDNFNAIDPNLVLDENGQPWLCFGSFWSGIKMIRIDPATGKQSPVDSTLYALAKRGNVDAGTATSAPLPSNSNAIEAPFLVRHGGFYYLFVSFDLCCRGTRSTYRTMVGRSHKVTGPYVDAQGKPMLDGGGTPLLTANSRWVGPGGESILQRPEGDIIVFHAYDAITGKPALQVSALTWEDGWPHAALGMPGELK